MSTVAEVKVLISAHFPAPANIAYGSWTAGPTVNNVPMTGWVQCWCVVREFSGVYQVRLRSFRLLAQGTGADTDTCYVEQEQLTESDTAKFRRLVLEWCAARVIDGWFIDVTQWGEGCALGWGINESGVVRTAKWDWETSEKLAVVVTLDIPVPGAPVDVFSSKVTLANDTTEIDFAGGRFKQLTVTANRQLSTTVTPSNVEATLVIVTTGTTSRNITFGTGFGRTQGTLATGTTAGIVYVIQFISDGTAMHEVSRTAGMAA
jgi:hypothetical protein